MNDYEFSLNKKQLGEMARKSEVEKGDQMDILEGNGERRKMLG